MSSHSKINIDKVTDAFFQRNQQESSSIAIDMQCTQSKASGSRGVGKYFSKLVREIVDANWFDRVHFFFNSEYPIPNELLKFAHVRYHKYSIISPELLSMREISSAIRSTEIEDVKPDIVLVGHLFEGFDEDITVPCPLINSKAVYATVAYDAIPLVLSDFYFKDKDFQDFYQQKISNMKKFHIVLSISQSTKDDLINFADIQSERIFVIGGGPNDFVLSDDGNSESEFLKLLSIKKFNYILYVGGDEYRKNLIKLVKAYSQISTVLRKKYKLVIACNISDETRRILIETFLLSSRDLDQLVITGYISDSHLKWLYQHTKLFVFPSLYEGLGLPILEALQYGAPCIASNTSSMKEILVESAYLFDPIDESNIRQKITECLESDSIREEFDVIRKKVKEKFNWQTTLQKTINIFQQSIYINSVNQEVLSNKTHSRPLRLAIFSPLLPSESGIGAYTSHNLGHLAKLALIDAFVETFNSDVPDPIADVKIYKVSAFFERQHLYDACIFHIGNSHFHSHMFTIIDRIKNVKPIVIVMHDAYLSSLVNWQGQESSSREIKEAGYFLSSLLENHGTQVRGLVSNKNNLIENLPAIYTFPIAINPLINANLVISHSPFNLNCYRYFYPAFPIEKYQIIPQMTSLFRNMELIRIKSRRILGLKDNDFVIVTAGHIGETKRTLDVIKVAENILSLGINLKLIILGALQEHGEYSNSVSELANKINEINKKEVVIITGFKDTEDYEIILSTADLGIQLRSDTRGGSPKGVIDFMKRGIPVIVNNYGSYRDYPNDVVIKLTKNPTNNEILNKITELLNNNSDLKLYGMSAYTYVKEVLNPNTLAKLYISSINKIVDKFVSNQKLEKIKESFHKQQLTSSIENQSRLIKPKLYISEKSSVLRKVYVDVSHITTFDHNSGIQRVVRELTEALLTLSDPGFLVVPVVFENGELQVASKFLTHIGYGEFEINVFKRSLLPSIGDVLLMLDSSWYQWDQFENTLKKLRDYGVRIIIPITDPSCFPPGADDIFSRWLNKAITLGDSFACISETTKYELIKYIKGTTLFPRDIFSFPLGSRFTVPPLNCPLVSNSEITLKDNFNYGFKENYFLMVGTIEPRKNHKLAINTFKLLSINYPDLKLVIAGRVGWNSEDLLEDLMMLDLYGKTIFLVESPTDEELSRLYKNCLAVLQLSINEGFGLPLIEAKNFKKNVLCSDIKIFREIAKSGATYVNNADPVLLSKQIVEWVENFNKGRVTSSTLIPDYTWDKSAKKLISILFKK